MSITPKNIVISRTDSIGDVILTLPLAGILKKSFPNCKIYFLCMEYTKPIIECCPYVDEAWCWKDIQELPESDFQNFLTSYKIDTFLHIFPTKELAIWAKKSNVKNRIGTSHRLYNLTRCTKLVNFTRKKSDLHEAQLNTKLLSPLFDKVPAYTLSELFENIELKAPKKTDSSFFTLIKPNKTNLILHAKSQGSAVEWGVENFIKLAKSLNADKFEIFFTGTEKEGKVFRDQIPLKTNIHDLTGKMKLEELITFINLSNGLIAASTGPLHIAGALNKITIGLFAPQKPIHSGRWKPFGNQSFTISSEEKSLPNQPLSISIRVVKKKLENLLL